MRLTNFGSPVSTAPGSHLMSLPSTTERNAIGWVSIWAIHVPHAEPAHWPNQSRQSGSCSAPTTSVPPFGTAATAVVGSAPAPVVLVLLPQAARVTESAVSMTSRAEHTSGHTT